MPFPARLQLCARRDPARAREEPRCHRPEPPRKPLALGPCPRSTRSWSMRRCGRGGAGTAVEAGVAALPAWIEREARSRTAASMRPVINATGVILHTNLGRAVLPGAAVRRMAEVARAYTTLEYDLARGGRGSRPAR